MPEVPKKQMPEKLNPGQRKPEQTPEQQTLKKQTTVKDNGGGGHPIAIEPLPELNIQGVATATVVNMVDT